MLFIFLVRGSRSRIRHSVWTPFWMALSVCWAGLASVGYWLPRRSLLSWHRSAISLCYRKFSFPYRPSLICLTHLVSVILIAHVWPHLLGHGHGHGLDSSLANHSWCLAETSMYPPAGGKKDSNKSRDGHAKETTRTGQPWELILKSFRIPSYSH